MVNRAAVVPTWDLRKRQGVLELGASLFALADRHDLPGFFIEVKEGMERLRAASDFFNRKYESKHLPRVMDFRFRWTHFQDAPLSLWSAVISDSSSPDWSRLFKDRETPIAFLPPRSDLIPTLVGIFLEECDRQLAGGDAMFTRDPLSDEEERTHLAMGALYGGGYGQKTGQTRPDGKMLAAALVAREVGKQVARGKKKSRLKAIQEVLKPIYLTRSEAVGDLEEYRFDVRDLRRFEIFDSLEDYHKCADKTWALFTEEKNLESTDIKQQVSLTTDRFSRQQVIRAIDKLAKEILDKQEELEREHDKRIAEMEDASRVRRIYFVNSLRRARELGFPAGSAKVRERSDKCVVIPMGLELSR